MMRNDLSDLVSSGEKIDFTSLDDIIKELKEGAYLWLSKGYSKLMFYDIDNDCYVAIFFNEILTFNEEFFRGICDKIHLLDIYEVYLSNKGLDLVKRIIKDNSTTSLERTTMLFKTTYFKMNNLSTLILK